MIDMQQRVLFLTPNRNHTPTRLLYPQTTSAPLGRSPFSEGTTCPGHLLGTRLFLLLAASTRLANSPNMGMAGTPA